MNLSEFFPSERVPAAKGFCRRLHIIVFVGVSCVIGFFEYLTNPLVLLPFLYAPPVVLLTRRAGWRWGLGVTAAAVLWRFAMAWRGGFYYGWAFHTISVLGLGIALAIAVGATQKLCHQAYTIEILKGLLPLCAHCKSIRSADGSWLKLEDYFAKHSQTKFTHGICPVCRQEHYPDYPADQA